MNLYSNVCFLLSRAQQTVSQIYRGKLAEFDLTPSQYIILQCLWEYGSLSPGQLAEATYIERPAITGILDRLESKGMIRRIPDYYDRRSSNICLTIEAAKMKDDIMAVAQEAHNCIMSEIDEKQSREFLDMLHMIANIPDI